MNFQVNYDENTKIWSGPSTNPIYNPSQNVGFLILNRFQQTPNEIHQIVHETGSKLTCKEIYEKSIKIANFLKIKNFKQGDVVGLLAKNSENVAPILFACLTLGLPFNPYASALSENDLKPLIEKTKPKAFFCDLNELEKVRNVVKKIGIESEIFVVDKKVEGHEFVGDIVENELDVKKFVFPPLTNISSEIALIMFTSGTTDSAKGICKTHKQVITNHYPLWLLNNPFNDGTTILTLSSISWITQLLFVIVSALYGFKRIIMSSPLDSKNFHDVVDCHKVAVAFISPSTSHVLFKDGFRRPLESLRHVIVGGSTFGKTLVDKLQKLAPNGRILACYGNTETDYIAVGVTGYRDRSSGVPICNIKLKVIDESGNSLGPSQRGEICIKSCVPFAGFYKDPINTSNAVDPDGWLYSGDIGFITKDGFVYIEERKKFMLKNCGYYITPLEIESVINEVEGVLESCVVGVYDENEGNDIIFGFVLKDEKSKVSEKEIENYANEKLSAAKRIRGGVHFIKEFPLSSNGKIVRKALMEIAINKLNEMRENEMNVDN